MRLKLLLVALLPTMLTFAQHVPKKLEIEGIPKPLEWTIEPKGFDQQNGIIKITAAAKTNMFYNPNGKHRVSNIPKLLFEPDSNYILSAKVQAKLKSIYEAGVLMVYANENYWAKFCFENESPERDRMVTVVNNKISDDANSYFIDGDTVYMRIEKKGQAFQFQYSTDGKKWMMVRHFTLQTNDPVKIGFASQSPMGKGLTSTFSEIEYKILQK